MAYMRGDTYIWTDSEDQLHIWNRTGYDAWNEAGWAMDEDGDSRAAGFENASGVSIDMATMDEYVMMRFAEIVLEGRVDAVIDAASNTGNFRSGAVTKNAELLKKALGELKLEEPDRNY